MYRNILVAIDDSETSRCALDEAINITRATGAKPVSYTHLTLPTILLV